MERQFNLIVCCKFLISHLKYAIEIYKNVPLIYFEDKRSIELDKSRTNLGINQFLLENVHGPEGKRILFELSRLPTLWSLVSTI